MFYETTFNTFGIKIDPTRRIRWNVASLCSSGYHNWNTTVPLNFSITGIRTIDSEKFAVFPNPANEAVYFNISTIKNTSNRLAVYDVSGREVIVSTKFPTDNKLTVSNLPKGWYQLVVETNDKSYITSFVKQ